MQPGCAACRTRGKFQKSSLARTTTHLYAYKGQSIGGGRRSQRREKPAPRKASNDVRSAGQVQFAIAGPRTLNQKTVMGLWLVVWDPECFVIISDAFFYFVVYVGPLFMIFHSFRAPAPRRPDQTLLIVDFPDRQDAGCGAARLRPAEQHQGAAVRRPRSPQVHGRLRLPARGASSSWKELKVKLSPTVCQYSAGRILCSHRGY